MTPLSRIADGGLLIIDKPAGMTSHDVVARVRALCRPARVGHTGTLDPSATGVLVICIGRATRLQSRLSGGEKEYVGTIAFGVETKTFDADGEIVATRPVEGVDLNRLQSAAEGFVGEIQQVPPPWSAKKIEGRRAYDLAREGAPPALRACPVSVHRFEILAFEGDRCSFMVRCSPGTYVRSLAHDLGRRLGCGAHLASLRRERNGPFMREQSKSLDEVLAAGAAGRLPEMLLPLESLDLGLPRAGLTEEGAAAARSGRFLTLGEVTDDADLPDSGEIRLISPEGKLIGIAEAMSLPVRGFQPRVVLVEPPPGATDRAGNGSWRPPGGPGKPR